MIQYQYINSDGGSIKSGFSIIDTINYTKSEVILVGYGFVASMASVLRVSGKKRK